MGFRYTVHNIAQQYDVRGYVRNLPDGRVELVMEGPEDEMGRLLADIQHKMGDYIDDTLVSDAPGTGQFQQFAIKH